MTDAKKYIWVFPLIGGIITLISLLTPAVSANLMGVITASLWVWDLYTFTFVDTFGTEFVTEPLVLIPSLISTCLLIIGGILLLTTGMKLKNRNLEQVNIKVPSILAGVVILIAELLWLSMVPTFFPMTKYYGPSYPGTFWSLMGISFHTAGFGIIGGFLSTAIAFGGAGAAHYYSKEREVIVPEKKEITPPIKGPTASETPELKFCPECGAEIEDPNIKFCGKCGFELKTPALAPL